MKRKINLVIGSILLVSIGLLTFSCSESATEETECNNSNQAYRNGYEAGKTSLYDSPETYKNECNNGAGMIGDVPPCWDEGFIDGHNSSN